MGVEQVLNGSPGRVWTCHFPARHGTSWYAKTHIAGAGQGGLLDSAAGVERPWCMDSLLGNRRSVFLEGARRLRATLRERGAEDLLPSGSDWYACPMCLDHVFTIEALTEQPDPLLREAHSRLGGEAASAVLVCWRCDGTSSFDVGERESGRLRRLPADALVGALYRDGATEDVDEYREMRNPQLTADSVTGLPAIYRSMGTMRSVRMKRHFPIGDVETFNIRIESRIRLNYGPPTVEPARTAYLVAFAAFGWRYICQPALDPLRDLFRGRSADRVPILRMTDRDAHPTRRQVWVVREPFGHRCVVVGYGTEQIVLPILDDPRTLDDLWHTFVWSTSTVDVTGAALVSDLYPWPARPRYSLDASASYR